MTELNFCPANPCYPIDQCDPCNKCDYCDPCDPCNTCNPYVTRFYKLPLWKANDVTSWMTGLNGAMIMIDQLFHDFSLRTGIEGVPDEVVETVQQLQESVNCLEQFRLKTIEDLSSTTKIVSDILGNIDLINQKIRGLEFNQSSASVRIKGIEQQLVDINSDIDSLVEKTETNEAGISENTQKFADLQQQLAEEIAKTNTLSTELDQAILDIWEDLNQLTSTVNTTNENVKNEITDLKARVILLENNSTS